MTEILKIIKYNLKIIFGNRFVYFLGASVIFYLIITGIAIFSSDSLEVGNLYNQLIFPGILLMFFPTTFGLQNDEDARILEILFGIPNYRYKVWLVRLLIIFLMVYVMINIFALLSSFILLDIPNFEMSLQLMVVLIFFGSLGFFLSTLVKNGNGAAVFMVIIGLCFWFLHGVSSESKWNVFLNPFDTPSIKETVFRTMVFQNRAIVLTASVVFILWGLIVLQRREKFIK